MVIHYRPSDIARRLLMGEDLDLSRVEDYHLIFKISRHGVVEEARLVIKYDGEDNAAKSK